MTGDFQQRIGDNAEITTFDAFFCDGVGNSKDKPVVVEDEWARRSEAAVPRRDRKAGTESCGKLWPDCGVVLPVHALVTRFSTSSSTDVEII